MSQPTAQVAPTQLTTPSPTNVSSESNIINSTDNKDNNTCFYDLAYEIQFRLMTPNENNINFIIKKINDKKKCDKDVDEFKNYIIKNKTWLFEHNKDSYENIDKTITEVANRIKNTVSGGRRKSQKKRKSKANKTKSQKKKNRKTKTRR